jgi:hypothetical protein
LQSKEQSTPSRREFDFFDVPRRLTKRKFSCPLPVPERIPDEQWRKMGQKAKRLWYKKVQNRFDGNVGMMSLSVTWLNECAMNSESVRNYKGDLRYALEALQKTVREGDPLYHFIEDIISSDDSQSGGEVQFSTEELERASDEARRKQQGDDVKIVALIHEILNTTSPSSLFSESAPEEWGESEWKAYKSRYRSMVFKLHPDLCPFPMANEALDRLRQLDEMLRSQNSYIS